MPSTQIFVQSGGIGLVSGNIFSGSYLDITPFGKGSVVGSILLKLAKAAAGNVYVGMPPIPPQSGGAVTQTSGGSLSSGGLLDGMEMAPGDAYTIPRSRLVSGVESIRIVAPATSSGAVLFWDLL